MRNSVFRKLPIGKVVGSRGGLKRSLGAFELTMMGIGVIIGSGIFVITGVAAAEHAGPGLVLSFLLAGAACGCAALCYAELASAVPASGGAYTFVYAGLGEIFGWFIGWCLTLEYVVAMSAVAVGWSAYVSNVLPMLGADLPQEVMASPSGGGMVNLPAAAVITVMALLQLKGTRESARLNNILVAIKMTVILLFIVLVAGRIDPANYDPFLPFGWEGVCSGAAVVFFAYLGFDAIANSAEEVIEPQKNMPKGIVGSLVIATILYIIVTFMLTGVTRYSSYAGVAAPVAFALNEAGVRWGSALVSAGAIAGLTTGVLVFLGSESRLIYSMARDGLLPPVFSRVSKNGVPGRAVACVWLMGCLLAGFLPIGTIAELCNMGTLWAFCLVSVTVIVLRISRPELRRGFRVPAVPAVPLAAMVMCGFLAFQLDSVTWTVFLIWTLLGMCFYLGYGRRHSSLR
ncbi:amino acid permease [Anaerovorax odorimutans]|uniref:Amino acid permease n=1 Tax=Anaerovorax odorimutans TaxID=109327 RepID=A0ABT1RRJ2_9FIRM|nr:amino acid permease [Anaerovorax odorimutans]MCQ4637814.1 amino acid permease [Anaerovorax odorimutans]